MKKLTSLQILMLMSLALGSSHMHGKHAINNDDLNEAVQLELKAIQDEQATIEVLTDLAASQPMVIERIIEDEANLNATFNSIKTFVNKKIKETEKLLKLKSVDEAEVARLAVELADAQAMLEKSMAKQQVKYKFKHKFEQSIKDALMKAEQSVKLLSERTEVVAKQAYKSIAKVAKKIKKSHASKAVVKASSSETLPKEAFQNMMADLDNAAIADAVRSDVEQQANDSANDEMVIANAMDDQAMIHDDSSQASDEAVV